jgi:quercetin dioxygenase-like cupin family protein
MANEIKIDSVDVIDWANVPSDHLAENIQRRFVSAHNVTVTQFTLGKGATVATHHHPQLQVTHVLKGTLRVMIEGQSEFTARAGQLLIIPSNVPHGVVALEETVVCDFFTPERTDWKPAP